MMRTHPYNPSTSPKMRMSTIVTKTLDSNTYARTHCNILSISRSTHNHMTYRVAHKTNRVARGKTGEAARKTRA